MIKPAIVAIGYNRPKLMKRLLDSVGKAYYEEDDISLIISIDESEKWIIFRINPVVSQ